MSDLCFPAMATPVSSCQYTMVPLQGLALVGHCPLDGHMTAPHGVYPANGECAPNGKAHHPTHCLPGLQQVNKTVLRRSLKQGGNIWWRRICDLYARVLYRRRSTVTWSVTRCYHRRCQMDTSLFTTTPLGRFAHMTHIYCVL